MRKVMLRMASFLSHIEKLTESIHRTIAGVCGGLVFFLMLLTISDVLGRDLFLKPVPGTLEITQSLLVFIAFLSLAHVLTYGEHVKITILIDRLSLKKRVWFDMFALAVGFLLMFLMSWRTLSYAIYSYQCKEVADKSFPIPLYFAKFALFIGCAMLAIQFLIQLFSHFFGKLFSEIPSDKGKNI